jgi:mannose-6-phosphate isomerase
MTPVPRSLLQPLLLPPARVQRVYRGGALLERWLGNPDPRDGPRPEAWFGAVNAARATGETPTGEGIGTAVVPETWPERPGGGIQPVTMPELLAAYPETMLGVAHAQAYGATTGVLLKVLDSAMRLTVQIHPDRAFASQHLGSPFGKDESWVVLAARNAASEQPVIYFGFREAVAPEDLRRWVLAGEIAPILERMHALPVQPGDVYYVPAGTPHAIGAGLLIAEVQEPTDFTISFDRWFASAELSDERRFLGLDPDLALSAVRTAPLTDWTLAHLRRARNPAAVRSDDGRAGATAVMRPIGEGGTDKFWVELVTVGPQDQVQHDRYGTLAVGVVIGGSGTLSGLDGPDLAVHQGQGFLLPALLGPWQASSGVVGLRLLVCGPQPAGVAGGLPRG